MTHLNHLTVQGIREDFAAVYDQGVFQRCIVHLQDRWELPDRVWVILVWEIAQDHLEYTAVIG